LIKRVPQRTCIACRRITAKRELIRLVCTVGGSVEVDISGRQAGRGAYLCRARECWEAGLKSGRLEHALRTTITEANRQQLISCGEDLMLGAGRGKDG
jgi:predicted RNA-binding protein YlxR (DUF448 family)